MDVRSSLSKRLMAWSRDLYMAAEILCVMRRFRSMERPRSYEETRLITPNNTSDCSFNSEKVLKTLHFTFSDE